MIDSSNEQGDRVGGDGKHERSVQNEVNDLLRRLGGTDTLYDNVAGSFYTVLVNGDPGVLIDAVQKYRHLAVDSGGEVVADRRKDIGKAQF